MAQKEIIIDLLKLNTVMTQGQIAEAIYGDKNYSPNIFAPLSKFGPLSRFRTN